MSLLPPSTKPPSGFRDFFGREAHLRHKMSSEIFRIYRSFGFEALETPSLENLNILMGSGGGENEKLIFRVMKRGEKLAEALSSEPSEESLGDLGLRFDLTVPLCRAVSEYASEIVMPWKVFHLGSVWRAERPQKARYREFIQCDVDIIGSDSVSAEAEVLQAVAQVFANFGLETLELKLSHRGFLEAFMESIGLSEASQKASLAVLLDKKDKLPAEKMKAELEGFFSSGLPDELDALLSGDFSLESVRGLAPRAYEEISRLMELLEGADAKISFDPSLARGMGYYTGCVYEWVHPSQNFALGGGGRYDELVGRFSKKSLPAVGCSIGFERLFLLLVNKMDSSVHTRTVFVPIFSEALRPQAMRIASELRQAGVEVDLFPAEAKIKAQFKFAATKSYRWVLILGDEELQSGRPKLKDFLSGEEHELSLDQLPSSVRGRVQ